MKHKFLLINKSDLTKAEKLGTPSSVAFFLWRKRLDNWLVIKDFESFAKVVALPDGSLQGIEKACEEA